MKMSFKSFLDASENQTEASNLTRFGANVATDTVIGTTGGVIGTALGGPIGGAIGQLGGSVLSVLAQRIMNAFIIKKDDPVKAVYAAMSIPDDMRKNDKVAQALDLPDDLADSTSEKVKMQIAKEVADYLQQLFSQPGFNINSLQQGIATKKLTDYLSKLLSKYQTQ